MKDLRRRVESFLGPRVGTMLLAGTAVGLSLFAVELAFAYGLQAFLLAIGALDAQTVRLPAWLPRTNLPGVLAFIACVGTLRAALNAAQIYMQGAANEELRHRHRSFLLRWALWSESASTADVITLFNARAEAAGQFVGNIQSLAILATSALLLGAGLFVMAPLITLATGAGLALIALCLLFTDRKALEAGTGLATEIDRVNGRLVMSLKNLLLLQIYGTQGREEKRAQDSLSIYRGHILSSFWISAVKYAVPQVFGVGLICLIALASKSRHGMAPGVLVSYFYLLLRLLLIFSGVNQNVATLLVTWPGTKELVAWWEKNGAGLTAPRTLGETGAPPAALGPIGWRLSHVGFAYPSGGGAVLDRLDLTVVAGSTLVVMGPSGAGKSTLLSLMLGLLEPQRGKIELTVADAEPGPIAARRAELLRGVGYVGPESFLLEGTIRENLLYGLDAEPSAAELDAALSQAEGQFVKSLPRGLEHELSEQGQGLSAGQKQRLALARALLRRPRVLILDEATANLDAETEARLVETLGKLKGRMTMLIVTHRPSLLALADQRLDLAAAPAR